MCSRVFLDVAAGYDNPNAIYAEGREALRTIEAVKGKVAKMLNTVPECLFAVPSASLVNYFLFNDFDVVGVAAIEHESVLGHAHVRELLRVDEFGRVAADEVRADLVSVALANHEIGTVQDLAAVKAANLSVPLHSDMTAAFGKMEIDLEKLPVDFATISGAKLGAAGAAFLYCRNPDNAPKLPVGTPNVGAIGRLGEVLDGLTMVDGCLRDNLRERIVREIADVVVNTPEGALPNLLNVSFAGAEGESIMLMLDEAGIAVSTGSACLLGAPSRVIMAVRDDAELAHNSIRFSLDAGTTMEDVNVVMAVLPNIIKRLRRMSTR